MCIKRHFCKELTSQPRVITPETKVVPPIKPIPIRGSQIIRSPTRDGSGRELIYANYSIRTYGFVIKMKLGLVAVTTMMLPTVFAKIMDSPEWNQEHLTALAIPFFLAAIIALYSKLYTRLIGKILYDPRQDSLVISTLSAFGNKKDREIFAGDFEQVITSGRNAIRIYFKDGSNYFIMFNPKVEVDTKRFNQVFKWSPPVTYI